MTVRDDVEYTFDDPDDGWYGAQIIEPEPPTVDHPADPDVADDTADDKADDKADTDSWYVPQANPRQGPEVIPPAREFDVVPTRHDGFVTAPRPASWESRLSTSGTWDFKVATATPWYRSKRGAVIALAAAAAAAVAVVLLVRTPAPTVEQPTNVTPTQPSGPAPTSVPSLSSQAPPPPAPPLPGLPPPPPPPAPTAEELNPPVVNRQYTPRYQAPTEPKKPQMNVTRAPLSATPPPPPKPDRNSGTPGDGPRRGGFGW